MSNPTGILIILVIVIIIFLLYNYDAKPPGEKFDYQSKPNMRLTPFWYSLFSYDKMQGSAAWPGNLFTRLKFWSPSGASTGSGLTYNTREGNEKTGYWQRNLWLKNNNQNYYVSNGEDYIHDMANYNRSGLSF